MILAEGIGADRVADRRVGGARVLLDGDGIDRGGGLVGLLVAARRQDDATVGIGGNGDG